MVILFISLINVLDLSTWLPHTLRYMYMYSTVLVDDMWGTCTTAQYVVHGVPCSLAFYFI